MEIKTIKRSILNADDFDALVNEALREGWFLERRYIIPDKTLIAEMVRGKITSKLKVSVKYFDREITPLEKIAVGDWIDLRAAETVELKQGQQKIIRLGVGMILPVGYEAHVLPRSSTPTKFGIMCSNSQGVIDNSYSGDDDEWKFPVVALRDTTIYKNDRIAQFKIVKNQPRIEFETVERLNNNSRGGFGSTGKR